MTAAPVEILAYPLVGKLAGILITWESENITTNTGTIDTTKETRLIKFSDAWMVSLQAGYLTIGHQDKQRTVVLTGFAACTAWELWQNWIRQNTYKPMP